MSSLQSYSWDIILHSFLFIPNLEDSGSFTMKAHLNLHQPRSHVVHGYWPEEHRSMQSHQRKFSPVHTDPPSETHDTFQQLWGSESSLHCTESCFLSISPPSFLHYRLNPALNCTEISRHHSAVTVDHDVTPVIFKFSPLQPHVSTFFYFWNWIFFFLDQTFLFRGITVPLISWLIVSDRPGFSWNRILATNQSGLPLGFLLSNYGISQLAASSVNFVVNMLIWTGQVWLAVRTLLPG